MKADFSKLVESLEGISHGERELVAVQSSLADNLRILRETQQIDQALHGLTAAIHLLTARNQPTILKDTERRRGAGFCFARRYNRENPRARPSTEHGRAC